MPNSSTITITYDGNDITNVVEFASCSFELAANAQPGPFEITVRDEAQTLSFTTGRELVMALDGVPLWGGFVLSVGRKFAFPAADTVTAGPGAVKVRQWVLRGVDYNILFDKRFTRNTSDYLHLFPNFPKSTMDGALIRQMCTDFLDIPAGFNTSSHVDDVLPPFDPYSQGISGDGAWLSPGSSWRAEMEDISQFSGSIWYLSAAKYLEYHSYESVLAPWGFSDVPDHTNFIGFRDLDLTEDGSVIVNDAMIWGGSQFAGSGQTVFDRVQNGPSIAAHSRWQRAEVHFGEKDYLLQSGVNARAEVIVNGAPGVVAGDPNRGLRFPQISVRLSWFSKDVPSRNHIVPGDIVTFNFWVLSEDGGVTPLTYVLPLRQLSMSFPDLDHTGDPYVIFTGTFGLQITDPYTLWTFIRHAINKVDKTPAVLATSTGSYPVATYGTLYSGAFSAAPDGSTTVFDLPNGFGYIAGTSEIFQNGKALIPGAVDYDETDPLGGSVTFTTAPASSDTLWMRCYLT